MGKVNIGKIVNTHGIKGEIKIISDFDKKNLAFKPGNTILIDKKEYIINTYRVHKNFDMITLNGFNDINQVLQFKGLNIYIERDELSLSEMDYILDDLIDMDVIIDDEIVGKVVDYSNDINPLLKIKSTKTFYIPIKSNYLEKVDIENSKLYVSKETRGLII